MLTALNIAVAVVVADDAFGIGSVISDKPKRGYRVFGRNVGCTNGVPVL